jgi:uncharacterized membrane protein HdeD (DUF308 family)
MSSSEGTDGPRSGVGEMPQWTTVETNTLAQALVPLVLLAVGFVVWVVIDIMRAESVQYLPKWAWIVISVISIPLGGIVYLLVGRDRGR